MKTHVFILFYFFPQITYFFSCKSAPSKNALPPGAFGVFGCLLNEGTQNWFRKKNLCFFCCFFTKQKKLVFFQTQPGNQPFRCSRAVSTTHRCSPRWPSQEQRPPIPLIVLRMTCCLSDLCGPSEAACRARPPFPKLSAFRWPPHCWLVRRGLGFFSSSPSLTVSKS